MSKHPPRHEQSNQWHSREAVVQYSGHGSEMDASGDDVIKYTDMRWTWFRKFLGNLHILHQLFDRGSLAGFTFVGCR